MNYYHALNLIRLAISENKAPMDSDVCERQYEFFNKHAIAPLIASQHFFSCDNSDIKKAWKEALYSNIYTYSNLVNVQNQILDMFKANNILVVVVKGTSAAKYYPKPQLRTMGDIDLLVKPDSYERAIKCLMDVGCVEMTNQEDEDRVRHKSFNFSGYEIELHRFFSSKSMSNNEAKVLDELLFNAIPDNDTVLPDIENGLVLLSHIKQHLKMGIGLRQIIDWFMFVKSCLDDEMWYASFQEKARVTGLERLAITSTRMCQIYLGLTTNITWCKDADEEVCTDLMQYVMDCGNFGRSRDILQSGSTGKLPSIIHPIQLLKYIQSHGERNWPALKKHPNLKPFAWIYQINRFAMKAIKHNIGLKKIGDIYSEKNERKKMLNQFGLQTDGFEE